MTIKVKLIEDIKVANPISMLLLDCRCMCVADEIEHVCVCVSFQGRLLLSNN